MDKPGELDGGLAPRQSVARDQPILCLAPNHSPPPGEKTMNEYQVTFANGEMVEVEAWTPDIARVIAEEEADLDGQSVGVELLAPQPTEG